MEPGQSELTRAGYERLRAELERLETTGRREMADAIGEARAHGDLSENAEYHAAKDEQAHLETRIAKLRSQLEAARIVDAPADVGRASLGAQVVVRYLPEDERETYVLVGSAEADAVAGRVSVASPLGRALLGTAPGDELEVQTPGGVVRLVVETVGAAS